MADTLDITAGAGTTIATDDVGGAHYQRIKLSDGTADATGVIAADIGVKANALRVCPANDITDATYIGDIKFGEAEPNSAAIKTAVELLDNAIDGAYLNVNLNIAGTDVAANAGILSAQTLRVTIATDDECNNYLGTIDADTGNMVTALQLLDNAVDGNYLNTNLNIAGTDCVGNAGVLAAGVLRVTIATDDECNNFLGTIDADTSNMVTALQLLDNAVYVDDADWTDNTSSHLLVGGVYQSAPHTITDGDVSPLEVNANGSLRVTDAGITACDTGAVVIASGTVTTVSTVTSLSQLGGQAINLGEGVIATGTQRVTIATDDDGIAHLATIAGAVSTQMQCDIVAALPAGDNNVGNVDIVTVPAPLNVVGGGAEATALRVTLANDSTGVVTIDGTVTADLSATDNAVLDAIDTVLDLINAKLVTGTVIGDVNLGATDNAVLDSIVTNTTRAAITGYGQAKVDNADTTTARVLVATAGAVKFYITSIILSVAAAGSYWIEDEDAAQITCKFTLAANGGVALSFPIDTPFKSTTANKGLNIKGSAAGVVGCQITYYTAA